MAYLVHEEAMTAQRRSYCFAASKPYIKTEAVFKETKKTAMVLNAKRDGNTFDKRMGRLVEQTGVFFVSKNAKTVACGGSKK